MSRRSFSSYQPVRSILIALALTAAAMVALITGAGSPAKTPVFGNSDHGAVWSRLLPEPGPNV